MLFFLSSSSSSLDPHIRAQWVAACCLMQQTCTGRSEAALNALVMSFCAAAWALVSLIFQALSHHDDIWSWGGVTLLRQDRRTRTTAAAAQEEVTSFASAEDVSSSSFQVTSGWGERKHDTFYTDFTLIKLLTQAVQQETEIQYYIHMTWFLEPQSANIPETSCNLLNSPTCTCTYKDWGNTFLSLSCRLRYASLFWWL